MTLLLSLLTLVAAAPGPHLRSGDIVLHASRSRQSAAIRAATDSPYSHVGLIEVASDGVFVIEAVEPVTRTPWARWRARGLGQRVTILRHPGLDEAAAQRVVAEARRYLGRPYDWYFGWSDEAMYCSELVHKAFLRGAGLEVGRLQPLESLQLERVAAAVKGRYGARVPLQLEVVTPASIAEDAELTVLVSTFDAR